MLSRIDKNQFKAEIKYRDDAGKLQSRAFQGTRQQLRKDINAEKDLSDSERKQLLQALTISHEAQQQEQQPFVGFIPSDVLWDSGGPESY